MFTSYDHTIGGTGGDYIEWFTTTQFQGWKGERNALFGVYGKRTKKAMPKVGETLFAEFKRSYFLFEFTKVTPSPENPTIFFGEVTPIKQKMKKGEEGNTFTLEG